MEPREPIQSELIHTYFFLHLISLVGFSILISENVDKIFLTRNGVHRYDVKTYNEPISDIDFEKWLEVMKSELDSMHSNQIWTLVDPSKNIVPIRYK